MVAISKKKHRIRSTESYLLHIIFGTHLGVNPFPSNKENINISQYNSNISLEIIIWPRDGKICLRYFSLASVAPHVVLGESRSKNGHLFHPHRARYTVTRSVAMPLMMEAEPRSIPAPGSFFRED